MCVRSGSPPTTRLDTAIRHRLFDPIRYWLDEAEETGGTDPVFAEPRLQANMITPSQRTAIDIGCGGPFGADLVLFVQSGMTDGSMIFAELCVESSSPSLPAAREAEV